MAKVKKPDLRWVHRHAGLASQFMFQDEGKIGQLETTSIIGTVSDGLIYIVECGFNVTDEVADGEYWWPEEVYLAVFLQEDGEPTSRYATDKELTLVGVE